MHPTISYHLATARAAELRSQAQRDALARAARHARTHKLEHAAPRLAAAGRRLLTSLRPRGRWRGGMRQAGRAQALVPPSADCRLSAGGTVEPEDQPHGGGLARAVRAQEPGDQAWPDREAQAVDRSVAPYRCEPPDLNHLARARRHEPPKSVPCSRTLSRHSRPSCCWSARACHQHYWQHALLRPVSGQTRTSTNRLARPYRPFGCHTRKPRSHHVAAHIGYFPLPVAVPSGSRPNLRDRSSQRCSLGRLLDVRGPLICGAGDARGECDCGLCCGSHAGIVPLPGRSAIP